MDAAAVGTRALARQVDRSPMAISHLRSGRTRGTNLENARAIARALNVPMRNLWRLEDIETFLPSAE